MEGRMVVLHADGRCHDSGRRRLGAIIGDNRHLGCNAVCNPGTILGPRCLVPALTTVRGYHPADSTLKPASQDSPLASRGVVQSASGSAGRCL